jgi:hypothetical protein
MMRSTICANRYYYLVTLKYMLKSIPSPLAGEG